MTWFHKFRQRFWITPRECDAKLFKLRLDMDTEKALVAMRNVQLDSREDRLRVMFSEVTRLQVDINARKDQAEVKVGIALSVLRSDHREEYLRVASEIICRRLRDAVSTS